MDPVTRAADLFQDLAERCRSNAYVPLSEDVLARHTRHARRDRAGSRDWFSAARKQGQCAGSRSSSDETLDTPRPCVDDDASTPVPVLILVVL